MEEFCLLSKKKTNNRFVDRYQISVIAQKFFFEKRENEKKEGKLYAMYIIPRKWKLFLTFWYYYVIGWMVYGIRDYWNEFIIRQKYSVTCMVNKKSFVFFIVCWKFVFVKLYKEKEHLNSMNWTCWLFNSRTCKMCGIISHHALASLVVAIFFLSQSQIHCEIGLLIFRLSNSS